MSFCISAAFIDSLFFFYEERMLSPISKIKMIMHLLVVGGVGGGHVVDGAVLQVGGRLEVVLVASTLHS